DVAGTRVDAMLDLGAFLTDQPHANRRLATGRYHAPLRREAQRGDRAMMLARRERVSPLAARDLVHVDGALVGGHAVAAIRRDRRGRDTAIVPSFEFASLARGIAEFVNGGRAVDAADQREGRTSLGPGDGDRTHAARLPPGAEDLEVAVPGVNP